MSARLFTLVVHDARLQWRYRIHAAYGAVVLVYAGLIVLAGPFLPAWVFAVLIVTDPSVLGFFFLGGLMLLEKAEAARSALAMTPVTAAEYLVAKTVTLTGIALVAVIILGLLLPGGVDWPVFLSTVLLVSVQFIGIGAVFALRFRTVTGYLVSAAVLLMPLTLPGLVAFLDPMPLTLAALPFAAPMRLLLVALGAGTAPAWEIGVMLAITAIYAVAGMWWGLTALKGELGVK